MVARFMLLVWSYHILIQPSISAQIQSNCFVITMLRKKSICYVCYIQLLISNTIFVELYIRVVHFRIGGGETAPFVPHKLYYWKKNCVYVHWRFVSSPKFSLEICVSNKSYFVWEFQAETLYVCPKPSFGQTYEVSAWNSHPKCDF